MATLTSCPAVNTYALSLLQYYTQNCATDRSQCNGNDYNINANNCECAVGEASAITVCEDGCNYLFGDDLGVWRATSVGVNEYVLNIGSIPTTSYDHLIGFTHILFRAGGQALGKITVGFTPPPPPDNLVPALGGTIYASFNDQECNIQQVWCNDEQTIYNFYIDCSMYEGGAEVNMCDQGQVPLTEESTIMEMALWGPFFACQDPSLLPSGVGGGGVVVDPAQMDGSPGGDGNPPTNNNGGPGSNPTMGGESSGSTTSKLLVGLFASVIFLCFAN